jgi:drug/metabolite transporter (DMT)-like permease
VKANHLTLKIFALIILNDMGDTLAQLIMKKGLIRTGITSVAFANIAEFAIRNASSVLVWLGVLVYILNFFVWIIILYKIDLSVAMPVGSFCYIFVPLSAVFFLHEHVSMLRWAGIALIVLGIHFVTQSTKTKEVRIAA